jgi:GNAT superfamily N-acetyltransferase
VGLNAWARRIDSAVSLGAVSNDLPEAMRRNMEAFYRLLGERSAGGLVVERGGLLAAIVPSCPNQSVVNAVVYEQVEAVRAAHDELRELYREAGVSAWRVWVPERDRALGEWLHESGHRLSGSPRAMMLDLCEIAVDSADDADWERAEDTGVLAALNEEAYGLPEGAFARALEALAERRAYLYVAREGGQPASCLAALDAAGDCGIYAVATRPSSRGRGLASTLMRHALTDARDRGCRTSSLQSSNIGLSVYSHLGYRDVCAIDTWECI